MKPVKQKIVELHGGRIWLTSQVGEGYSLPAQIAFTVQEACEILRVSENTMYDALRRGRIKSVRLGRGYRIPRRAFETFLTGD